MFANKRLICPLFILFLTGCVFFAPDPHENYIAILHSKIGYKWNELPAFQFPSEKYLVAVKTLPNGNLEKKYRNDRGTCIDIYEIDPKTNVIIGVGFEGKNEDCVINP